ncbi:NHL repeat-containing protein [Mucilaginibacter sp.]|uniref:NHL repeat-containing protein n=1 Tax=Mucilaginibacter sp. TaxID=1882438 RepID=UPI003D10F8B0
MAACNKAHIKPNTLSDSTIAKNDSIAKADTLPSFNSPTGLAIDAAGNLYVADYGNNLIRKIAAGGVVSTFAGSGTEGSINALGVLASFTRPMGIAVDASGNLYVADSGNELIRKINSAGLVSTLAGSDSTGSANGASLAATFFSPSGVAVDASGNVYVADAGNNQIRKITTGGTVSTLAGLDTLGMPAIINPTGVAVDNSGNILVANYLNNNILLVNSAGSVSLFAGTGQGSANGPAASASFYLPNSVAVDAAGNVYVADGVNNLIRKISTPRNVTTLAGNGSAGAVDSTGVAASFNGPAGLAVDVAGNVYVADSNNNLIRKITPAGVVTTIAGSGQQGAKNGIAIAHSNTKGLKALPKNRVQVIYKTVRRGSAISH